MKSNSPQSLSASSHLKAVKQELPVVKLPEHSPYLKAVLADKRDSGPARVLSMANSSLAAALRYIANSKQTALVRS
ncbi:MAG: hypothetical protein LH619_12355 [Chitinophagaceae bacterium]|nr:hypothetical protein [Chitinophagaceae bacterium]